MSGETAVATKTCPGCQSDLPTRAVFCFDCGHTFPDTDTPTDVGGVTEATKICPDCAEQVGLADVGCRFCGHSFGQLAATAPLIVSQPRPNPGNRLPSPPSNTRTVGDALQGLSVPAAIALGGAAVMAVGSLGPWVDTFMGSASGTRGDGQITLVAAILAVVFVVLMSSGKGGRLSIAAAILSGLVGGVIGIVDLVNIQSGVEGATLFGQQVASVGWGLYAVIAGAIVIVLGVASAASAGRQPRNAA